jgi:hypothetical protein
VSGTTNLFSSPQINSRLSLIVAIRNKGNLNFIISQVKINLEIFKIFMVNLIDPTDQYGEIKLLPN